MFAACVLALLAALQATHAVQPPSAPPGWIVDQWTVEDGLPSDTIAAVRIDADDRIWLATANGLASFDGARFAAFDSSSHPQLRDDRIEQLLHDASGRLWFVDADGRLARHADGAIVAYGVGDGLPDATVTALSLDPRGRLLVATRNGCARHAGDRFEPLHGAPPGLDATAVLATAPDTLWIGTRDGALYRLADGMQRRWDARHGWPRAPVAQLAGDRRGGAWVGVGDTLWHVDGHGVVPGAQAAGAVLRLERAIDGPLHVTTANGVATLRDGALEPLSTVGRARGGERLLDRDPLGRRWTNTIDRLAREDGVALDPAAAINDFALDGSDHVWIATAGDGLLRLRPLAVEAIGAAEGLASDDVHTIVQAVDGAMWIGAAGGGATRIDGAQTQRWGTEHGVDDASAILPDGDAGAWIGGRGLCRLSAGRCVQVQAPAPLAQARILGLHRDRRGWIWVASAAGLFRRIDGAWTELAPDGMPVHAQAFAETADGALWLGTADAGLLRFDVATGTRRVGSADGLASDRIGALHVDAQGTLWIGTEDRGLCRLRSTAAQPAIRCIDRRSGLLDDSIRQILQDAAGRLWISTPRGIFHVEQATLEAVLDGVRAWLPIRRYDERDGMRSREANGGVHAAGAVGADGSLWFPTRRGVARFFPQRPDAGQAIHVRIAQLSGDGFRARAPTGRVELPAGVRALDLRIDAYTLSHVQDLYLRYAIGGGGWRDLGRTRELALRDLEPGAHRISVRAELGGRAAQRSDAELVLVVPAYPHESRLAHVLAVLAGIGALVLLALRRRPASRVARPHADEPIVDADAEPPARQPLPQLAPPAGELRTALCTDELLQALADLERAQRAQTTIAAAGVEVGALVLDLLRFVFARGVGQEHPVRFDLHSAPVWIVADAAHLRRALYAVLCCIKDGHDGRALLHVRVAQRDGTVVVDIDARGDGDDRRDRVERAAVRSELGLRLRLLYCDEIVRLHGGTLETYSDAGRVVRARVTIPHAPHDRAEGDDAQAADGDAAPQQRPPATDADGRAPADPREADAPAAFDAAIVQRARRIVEARLEDPAFGVVELATALHQSRASLHRHFDVAIGITPGRFIRELRLARAAALLRDGTSVSQAAFAVGFESLTGFSRAFHEHFGVAPSGFPLDDASHATRRADS